MTKNEDRERRILATMNFCNCSYEEAKQIIQEDEAIDRGERLDWEPTVEEEREMRKNAKLKVERKPRAKGAPRQKAPDLVKRDVIQRLYAAIKDSCDEINVANIEKTIDFSIGGELFTIDLLKHRKKKDAK